MTKAHDLSGGGSGCRPPFALSAWPLLRLATRDAVVAVTTAATVAATATMAALATEDCRSHLSAILRPLRPQSTDCRGAAAAEDDEGVAEGNMVDGITGVSQARLTCRRRIRPIRVVATPIPSPATAAAAAKRDVELNCEEGAGCKDADLSLWLEALLLLLPLRRAGSVAPDAGQQTVAANPGHIGWAMLSQGLACGRAL